MGRKTLPGTFRVLYENVNLQDTLYLRFPCNLYSWKIYITEFKFLTLKGFMYLNMRFTLYNIVVGRNFVPNEYKVR